MSDMPIRSSSPVRIRETNSFLVVVRVCFCVRSSFVGTAVHSHKHEELVVSIILIPMVCDVLQFAFVDSILKKPRGQFLTNDLQVG